MCLVGLVVDYVMYMYAFVAKTCIVSCIFISLLLLNRVKRLLNKE
jgi:hypothetical protein